MLNDPYKRDTKTNNESLDKAYSHTTWDIALENAERTKNGMRRKPIVKQIIKPRDREVEHGRI